MAIDVAKWSLAALILGVVSLADGWRKRGTYAQMAGVDPTPVRQLSEPGVVEVEGAASASDGTLSAPVTGREAVLAAWSIEEFERSGRSANWDDVASGIESVAFEVDDGTAAVRVEPLSKRAPYGGRDEGVRTDGVVAEFDSFPVEAELAPDEDPPDDLRELQLEHDIDRDPGSVLNAVARGTKFGERRFSEQVIKPGDSVYVNGRVEDHEHPDRERIPPADAVITEPDDGVLVVSTQTEESLEAEFGSAAWYRLVGGGALTLLGLAGFASLL